MAWWYRYLRADMEEIDMGPYQTEVEANKASAEHSKFGAPTTKAFEMPEDFRPYQGEDDE